MEPYQFLKLYLGLIGLLLFYQGTVPIYVKSVSLETALDVVFVRALYNIKLN